MEEGIGVSIKWSMSERERSFRLGRLWSLHMKGTYQHREKSPIVGL